MTKKHRISAVFRTFIQLQVLKTREDNREYLEFLIEDPKIKVQDWEGRFRQVGKIAKEEGITQFDAEDCDEFPLEMEVLREIYNPANKD